MRTNQRDLDQQIYTNQEAKPAGGLFETYADRVLRRVDEVLAGRECSRTPTMEEGRLLGILRKHVGVKHAIMAGELCERLRITPRTCKELVQQLRLVFGVQIGSSRSGHDGGYYLISSDSESIESTGLMLAQINTMLKVVHRMRGGGSEQRQQLLKHIAMSLSQESA